MVFNLSKSKIMSESKRIIGYGTGVNAYLMLSDKRFQPFMDKLVYFVDMDKRKHGQKLVYQDREYPIMPVETLEDDPDTAVAVTISDYIQTGSMLDEKNIKWVSWVSVISDIDPDEIFRGKDDSKPSLILMNTPDYINLGDHAIAAAEDIYIRKNFGDYFEFGSNSCTPQNIEKISKYLKNNDIIFFQGGGNLGSLWRTNEELLRNILTVFPDNPVIVFPQSVYYGETEEENEYFRKSQEIYNAHSDLLICSRDKRSYDFIKNSYSCECFLLPDIVMTLQCNIKQKRKNVGVILRHDKEQNLADNYEETIDSVLSRLSENKTIIDHQPVRAVPDRMTEINRLMEQYAGCKLIITDRLHGMIFSAVTATPCIAFDNSYRKVSDLYETWLKDCPYITVSEPLPEPELKKLVHEKLMPQNDLIFDNEKFIKKYDPLTDYTKKYFKEI